jgi:hypothetical protein
MIKRGVIPGLFFLSAKDAKNAKESEDLTVGAPVFAGPIFDYSSSSLRPLRPLRTKSLSAHGHAQPAKVSNSAILGHAARPAADADPTPCPMPKPRP